MSTVLAGQGTTGAARSGKGPARGTIRVIRSSRDTGEHLAVLPEITFPAVAGTPQAAGEMRIHRDRQRQSILGFGGAFTEAAAHTLSQLSAPSRKRVVDAYFHPERGSGYTLCRTHINSCDFALGNYAYAETAGDRHLEQFSIDRDRKWLIPMIQEAAGRMEPGVLRLLASPWSPPAWMKTNGQMNHGGKLKPEYRDAWALYFVKYIRAYAQAGIPIWGVSVQNEPRAVQTWDSCIYSHEEQRDFVRDHLGPRLAEHGLGDVRILVWDHNKDEIVPCADAILDDPQAARYVWGVGFHWYSGDDFDELAEVHRKYPDKHLVFTEGCQEGGVRLGSWSLGERYGHAIIGDLRNWTAGWIDWNMLLDQHGGPNHAGNYCDAPIIADTETDTVHFQSAYYYIAHFSRFFQPESVVLEVSFEGDTGLEGTACLRPDGTIAAVVMNTAQGPRRFRLSESDRSAPVEIPGRSIATLLLD